MNIKELNEIVDKIWIPFLERLASNNSIFRYKKPSKLKSELDLSLSEKGTGKKSLEKILLQVVEHTPDTTSSGYLNYLYSSPDPIGVVATWLTTLLNTNVHAYEASPVLTLIEKELVRTLNETIGYETDSDGIFCPGASYANMLAMYLARKRLAPEQETKIAVFTSEQSHYSIDRAAAILGIEKHSVYKIKCDHKGRMLTDDLKRQMEKAERSFEVPFFLNATLGTTVLGAFDPLIEIKEILSWFPTIWLHVDGAWGAPVLFSEKYKKNIAGIEQCDSVTLDFHKALNAPLLCSGLFVKRGANLKNMFDDDTSYLFHENTEEENYNLGEKTPQCGRIGDAFKFWLMWKIRGRNHFANQLEKRFSVAKKIIGIIKSDESFLLYDEEPDFWNICFWYLPSHLRHFTDIEQYAEEDKESLEKLTLSICRCIKKDGRVWINHAKIKKYPSFIRLVLNNGNLTSNDFKKFAEIIKSLGDILSSDTKKILTSGGDERLEIDTNRLNYILISPEPRENIVSRSSCTGSYVSEENYRYLERLLADMHSAKVSFSESMKNVHYMMRDILQVDHKIGIVTIPSGTDSEYIPLLIAEAYMAKYNYKKIINIVTGSGEIGSDSAVAASGRYYKATTPSGYSVNPDEKLFKTDNLEVINISLRCKSTGKPIDKKEIWKNELEKYLADDKVMVILHIVDSSKLGYRMDFVEDIKSLNRQYSKRLLTVIDACQSRADISRIRQYLKYGCMVIITGSKFEEGPPFSGATIIPEMITDSLTKEDFVFFPDGLKNFITEYDVSGSIKDMLSEHLPSWMNCGLMMRWTCALINWQNYRSIEQEYRNRMVREWIANFLNLAKQYPDLEIFSGGEAQQGAVGDLNSIISLKIIYHDKPIQIDDARTIYHLLFKDITLHLPEVQGNEKCSVLKQRFLIGQPVNLGHFAVLRVALGAKLVCRIEKYGMENILKDDKALLLKLSLILKHYDKIRKNYKRK